LEYIALKKTAPNEGPTKKDKHPPFFAVPAQYFNRMQCLTAIGNYLFRYNSERSG
jgi:hypothetical protein